MPKPSTQPSRDTMIRELNSILDQLEALSKKSRKYDRKIISPMSDAKLKTQLSEAKRKLAEKTYINIKRWSKMQQGGHFAAFENSEALAKEMFIFFNSLKL